MEVDIINTILTNLVPLAIAIIAAIIAAPIVQKLRTDADKPKVEIEPFESEDDLGFSIRAKKNTIEGAGVYWNGKLKNLYDSNNVSHDGMTLIADGPSLHFVAYKASTTRAEVRNVQYASITVKDIDSSVTVFESNYRFYSPAPVMGYTAKKHTNWRTEIRVFGKNLRKQSIHRFYLTINPMIGDEFITYQLKLEKKPFYDPWPPY